MFTALLPRLLKMTSFTRHSIRKRSAWTGGGLSGRCSGAGRRKDLCRRLDGRLLSRFRAAQRRNRYVYNCLAKLSWLKMTFFRPLLRRKWSARKGGGHQDDRRELDVARTNRSRRPHRFKFARPQIPPFSHFSDRKLYILRTI